MKRLFILESTPFLDSTGQLYKSQYGFRSKHSCEHAVSKLLGDVLKGQEKGEHTVSVYLDLSKAFDTLEHTTLFKKMEIYGIRGVPLDWFKSYLTGRTLRVKCNISNCDEPVFSEQYNIKYGTPQGSCLGPLLFLIFCNDIYLNLVYSTCILFADDTTVYSSGRNLQLLLCSLEHDLNILDDWFKANKLTLNMNKTVCMLFKGNSQSRTNIQSITINGTPLPFVNHTKFLGIWIDTKLQWNEHVSRLLLKLKHNSHMMLQSKNFLTKHAKNAFTMHKYIAIYLTALAYGATWLKRNV